MRILLIRHGDPDYAHDTLTEKGWREAKALAAYLKDKDITKFYCSPLGRAKDTASLTLQARGQEAEVLDYLREFDAPMPDPETGGMSICWDYFPREWMDDPLHFDPDHWMDSDLYRGHAPGPAAVEIGQKLDALLARHGYERTGNYYRVVRPNHDTIALVCHFGITCVLLGRLLHISPIQLFHQIFISPTGMTMVETEEREEGFAHFRMRYLGATPHLQLAGEPASASGMFKETFADPTDRMDIFKD
ncbi:MAG: histidine phosphatase family protein [Clostridiales bacterium]|nr:histidine phosphatase family protein [Clostridiales bacterium]